MIYKCLEEEGNYLDITTDEPRNLLQANIAYTPEGVNVGWTEYDTLEDAMEGFNLKIKPEE